MNQVNKRLYRSRENKMVAGVAGGLGEYFEIDPVLIRLLFVLLILADGAGLIMYVVFAIIVPKRPLPIGNTEAGDNHTDKDSNGKNPEKINPDNSSDSAITGRTLLGIGVIIVGLIVLLNDTLPVILLGQDIVWAVLIIIIGAYIVFSKKSNNK